MRLSTVPAFIHSHGFRGNGNGRTIRTCINSICNHVNKNLTKLVSIPMAHQVLVAESLFHRSLLFLDAFRNKIQTTIEQLDED